MTSWMSGRPNGVRLSCGADFHVHKRNCTIDEGRRQLQARVRRRVLKHMDRGDAPVTGSAMPYQVGTVDSPPRRPKLW